VAQSLAVAYIEQQIFGDVKRAGTNGTKVSDQLTITAERIQQQVFKLQAQINDNLSHALHRLQQTSAWVAQLHQVQSILYRSTLTQYLASNFAYSSALTASGNGMVKKTGDSSSNASHSENSEKD
jgi:hypothetical protein